MTVNLSLNLRPSLVSPLQTSTIRTCKASQAQAPTSQEFAPSSRAIWRTNSSSRQILATQPMWPERFQTRTTLLDLPLQPTTSTIKTPTSLTGAKTTACALEMSSNYSKVSSHRTALGRRHLVSRVLVRRIRKRTLTEWTITVLTSITRITLIKGVANHTTSRVRTIINSQLQTQTTSTTMNKTPETRSMWATARDRSRTCSKTSIPKAKLTCTTSILSTTEAKETTTLLEQETPPPEVCRE